MAEPDLIEAYLTHLHRCIRFRSDAADVVAEAEDHVREAVERLCRAGADPIAAQRITLERFGDPVVVARALSTTAHGGIAMPTAFTRAAGTAALASALAWVLAAAALSVNGLRGGDDGLYILFAIPAMLAAVTTAVALAGLLSRAGGRRDAGTVLALVLACSAAAMMVVAAWAWPVWTMLIAAAALIAVLKARSALVGAGSTDWLLVAAWPAGLATFVVADRMRLGDVDTYGDYPSALAAGFLVGATMFVLGLVPLGRWLRSEQVVMVGDSVPSL
jgi:hypothetical protein